MNTLLKPLALTFLVALSVSCTKKAAAPTSPTPTPAAAAELLTTGKVLAESKPGDLPYKMYRFLAANPRDVCLSPVSLEQAFGMLYLGTNGKTKTLVEGLFGFKDNQVPSLNDEQPGDDTVFHWGNSIWIKPGESLRPSYLEDVKQKLGAHYTQSIDVKKINAWVSERTKDRIHDFLQRLELETNLVLINAFYLKAEWARPFEPQANRVELFQSSPHQSAQVTYLTQTVDHPYYENADGRWLELPYSDAQLSMLVALPKQKFGLRAIEERLSAALLDEVTAGLKRQKIELRLPKFRIETNLSLKRTFVEMGYADLFQEGDYSRMTLLPRTRVTDVLQATYLKVDEKGTEAAAATAIEARMGAAPDLSSPKPFHANEPFVFILRNKQSGRVYFIGRVYAPKS